MAITIADPGGPIEMAKESFATLKAASAPSSQQELLVAVSEDPLPAPALPIPSRERRAGWRAALLCRNPDAGAPAAGSFRSLESPA
jgi:hypothetical protein